MSLGAAAAAGRFELPVCSDCGAVQYPIREVCVRCLSDQLHWREVPQGGILVACTRLHRSMDTRFAPRLPLKLGAVKLDVGPMAIALLAIECMVGGRVRVRPAAGPDGKTTLVASAA